MIKRLTVNVLILVMLLSVNVQAATFDERVSEKLTGGAVATRSMSIWQIEKYRYTKLMRKYPMSYEPFQGYLTVIRNTEVKSDRNLHWLIINSDLTAPLKESADLNKDFAKAFKVTGTRKQQVKQIYNYCHATRYTAHVKTAREVFRDRQGDCAGIASAFCVLCRARGIPVRFVIGYTAEKECHAWNKVKLGGKWYWLDCTSGDWLTEEQIYKRTVMEVF